ncbi:MAG: CidA/LrgA family protein [Comamonadaceae bacterium]|nr:MAG: CidA/LrgA family protein [Comamonadaceae bacterium]
MVALRGLACLLLLQSIGELLSRGLALPFPGPVVGMVLLLLALQYKPLREPVSACACFLLSHLSLLFVPVGVGVMTHLSLVGQYGFRMLAVIVVSTLAGLAVTALCLAGLRNPNKHAAESGKEVEPHA